VTRFLIDTSCWLWAVSEPERLRPAIRELLEDSENTVFFSAISAFEIAIKFALGKLRLPMPPSEMVPASADALPVVHLPVYVSHGLRVGELPAHHNDPFDRLLIAQSQIEDLPIMTADHAIAQYDVEVIWAGRGRAPRRR